MLTDPPRPLTARELDRLAGHLAAGHSLHPDQQRALLSEVRRLRAELQLARLAAAALRLR